MMANAHFVPRLSTFLFLLDHRLEMLQTLCDSVQASAGVHVFILAQLVPHGMCKTNYVNLPSYGPHYQKEGSTYRWALSDDKFEYIDTNELQ